MKPLINGTFSNHRVDPDRFKNISMIQLIYSAITQNLADVHPGFLLKFGSESELMSLGPKVTSENVSNSMLYQIILLAFIDYEKTFNDQPF